MTNLFLYIVCLILGGAGAWLISRWGKILGLLDKPNERSSHKELVPKGGGVGILATFVVSSLLLNIPSGFWLPITAIALFSLCADRIEFSPKFRLSLQFIAAIILLFGINTAIQNQISGFLLILAMAVFIVGTANFYNFMDGINGIAAITGIVGFGLLALYSFLSESYSSFAVLSVCIYFSCLGFLPFNIPKARIFMGDVGSILLGFTFAGMVVWHSKGLLDFICLAAFLFPFYADELTTMAVRIRDGENLLRAHRRHLYQLLANEKGVSQWKVSVGYGLLQLVVGVTVLLLKPFGGIMVLSILIVYFVGFTMASYFIRKSLTTT
jgi:Fuc2NAc and GlcNAc transferase